MRYVLVSVINPQRFFKSTCEHSSQKIWINDKAAFCCGPDKLYGKITGNKTRKKKISREYNRSYWRKEKKTDGLQSCRQSYEFESVRNDFNKIDRYCASHECRRKSGEFFNYKTHLDVTYKTRNWTSYKECCIYQAMINGRWAAVCTSIISLSAGTIPTRYIIHGALYLVGTFEVR